MTSLRALEHWVVEVCRTWYYTDEYHIHGNKGGYIRFTLPTTRSTRPRTQLCESPHETSKAQNRKGYGILVHGQMKNGQPEDYWFLIDNGDRGYYRVIEHKGALKPS